MSLLKTIATEHSLIRRYLSRKSAVITDVVRTPISGVGEGIRVIKKNVLGIPSSVSDVVAGKKEIFTRNPSAGCFVQSGNGERYLNRNVTLEELASVSYTG